MLYKDWFNEWLEIYVKVSTKERTYSRYQREAEKHILFKTSTRQNPKSI